MSVPQERLRPQNPLALAIEKRIKQDGPWTFRSYQDACLHGIVENGRQIPGYYNGSFVRIGDNFHRRQNVDFTTPPEMSPLFGFMMARQITEFWEVMGKPTNFEIVEAGAGNGTLAEDILNGISHYQGLSFRPRYTVIESSPTLLKRQRERLSKYPRVNIIQQDALQLPVSNITGVVLTCELLDTFPAHVVRRQNGQLQELFVNTGDPNFFAYDWGNPSRQSADFIASYRPEIVNNSSYAAVPQTADFINRAARALSRGYVLTVDYARDGGRYTHTLPIYMYGARVQQQDDRDILNKASVGTFDLTEEVDLQVVSDAGKRAGLKTEGHVSMSGWMWGSEADFLDDELPVVLSGRRRNDWREQRLLEDDTWQVLIQSKNVPSHDFQTLRETTNPDKQRNLPFHPIRY